MKTKGFTLIELMITIAIVGILATVAIGEYLSYQAKAKQAEAKVNLEAIGKMAEAYRAEHDTYFAYISELGWSPNQRTRYKYRYNSSSAFNTPTETFPGVDYSDPGSFANNVAFSAYAVGNIDTDAGRDIIIQAKLSAY